MIILIGGASCCGKTTMAQRLLERYHMNYLSIDHLKMGLIRGSKYCDFTASDSDDSLTDKLWPIIKGIIMTNIENDQNLIIEGCYIPTDNICSFNPEYQEHIIAFFLGFNEQYILENLQSGIIDHRSETEYKDIDYMQNNIYFLKTNKLQKERCKLNNVMFFEIATDYTKDIQKVYDWVDIQVQKKKLLRFNKC